MGLVFYTTSSISISIRFFNCGINSCSIVMLGALVIISNCNME